MSKRKVKKTENFRSLTVTVAIAFLTLSAVVLVISSSLNMYSSFRNQRKIINGQQQHIARDAANTVEGFIREKFSMLEVVASRGNLVIIPQEEQKPVLEKLLGLEPVFRQLVLLNAQKEELLRVSRLSKLLSVQLMEYNKSELFSKVSQKETYISPIYIDKVTSEPMVIMAVPITDVFGDFKGTLIAEANLKFMWDLMDQIEIGKNGYAYVVNMQGYLIAFRDISRVLRGENLIHLKEVAKFVNGKELPNGGEAEISKGIKNTYVVATHVPLGTPNWAVVVELPVLEAYETVTMALIISALVILLSFALAIVFGIYLSKRITKPIIDLRDATRKISKGNLEVKIESKSKDEIGQLSRAFDRMTINLKRSRNLLEEYSANLMKKVKERTAELDKKVKESERQMVATLNLAEDLEATSIDLKEEVAERKQAEEKIQAQLREKEILLKEVHHRVKNNLQVISSLLKLQSQNIEDKQFLDMFKESQNRVKSMALVHEKLYQSRDLARIDFAEYIKSLANSLYRSHGADSNKIAFKIEVENVSLGINQAIPCGLIINELVSNSLKYAFPRGWQGKGEIRISVRLTAGGEIELLVSDSGVGVPKDLDFRKTESLGLHLVSILAEDQLQGKITLDRKMGTKFQIKFRRME